MPGINFDIRSEIQKDWQTVLAGSAVIAKVPDVAAFVKTIQIPSLPELGALNATVNTLAGYVDGDISFADLQAAGNLVGQAIGNLLQISLASIGLAAGPIGAIAGIVVGEAIKVAVAAFHDDTLEKRALLKAEHEASGRVADQIKAWEESSRARAWQLIAALAGDDVVLRKALEGFSSLTPEEDTRIRGYQKRSMELLTRWGFAPKAPATDPPWSTWGHNGSWEWISWNAPEQCGTLENEDQSQCRTNVRIDHMLMRLEQDSKAVSMFEAYISTLRGIRDGAVAAQTDGKFTPMIGNLRWTGLPASKSKGSGGFVVALLAAAAAGVYLWRRKS